MVLSSFTVCYHFRTLRDPRRKHLRRHLLIDVIAITLCAVIAGADDWQQVATWARHREVWLRTFLTLPHGIPSHDTLERVFDRLDPVAVQACFQAWVKALAKGLGLEHIAIDGKTMRHSGGGPKGWKALHLVSAWATQAHLSLGQVAVEEKSNEITAIPKLLELLDVKGALVTIDAMGCQKEIAKKIVQGGGDYVFTVKGNQPNLLEDIEASVKKAVEGICKELSCETYQTTEQGHGRQEKRTYVVLTNLGGIRNKEAWEELKVIGACTCERVVDGKESEETRYFIGSRLMGAKEYGIAMRDHWGIENNLHWQLDVTFGEDANRVQARHGAENLALIRRLALMLLKRQTSKQSIACKRMAAACDTDFLENVLNPKHNLEKA